MNSETSSRPPRVFFWCVAIVVGIVQVWAHRNDVSPDSISYVEIGGATARDGLHQIVNAYWSPLYPFLLSILFRFLHPSAEWEFAAVHFLNFVVYLGSLACFELFLKELILARLTAGELPESSLPVSDRTIWIWGYVFFLWASCFWLGPAAVTPDLCVAVVVYLASALLFRIGRGRRSWIVFAGLGALLGIGYLTKAAMFPVSFVFLFSAFCLSRGDGVSFRGAALRTLLATGTFAIFALPLIVSLSAIKGRATFGDAGRINYTEYVNRATRWVHWQGEPAGTGSPAHPTRKIFSEPAVFEFASPVQGSYPPWYDPSYWYEGVRPQFVLKDQLWALFRGANMYLKIFSKSGALWMVLLALWIASKRVIAGGRLTAATWLVILPSLAALALYALVHVEFRFIGPLGLILVLVALARVRIMMGTERRWVGRFHLVMILAPALAVAWAVSRDLFDVIANKPYEPWVVAQQLHTMGIPPGTEVGVIGSAGDTYWAHLGGMRIIAEIPEKEDLRFVAADDARRQQVLALFSSVGAKIVVTGNAAVANPAEGWREIPGTRHFVLELTGSGASTGKK
jgi:hypothetical protein